MSYTPQTIWASGYTPPEVVADATTEAVHKFIARRVEATHAEMVRYFCISRSHLDKLMEPLREARLITGAMSMAGNESSMIWRVTQ